MCVSRNAWSTKPTALTWWPPQTLARWLKKLREKFGVLYVIRRTMQKSTSCRCTHLNVSNAHVIIALYTLDPIAAPRRSLDVQVMTRLT